MYQGIRFEFEGCGLFYDEKIFKRLVREAKKVCKDPHEVATFLEYYCSFAPSPYEQYSGFERFEGLKFAFADTSAIYEMFNLDNNYYIKQLEVLMRGKITAKMYKTNTGVYSKDLKEVLFFRPKNAVVVKVTKDIDELFDW